MSIFKDFFKDTQTQKALDSSEVFREYIKAELEREKNDKVQRVEDENNIWKDLNDFKQKVASNKELKEKLKKAQAFLKENPEEAKKVDPDFILGLELLELEDL